jgi:hypothetical protein
MVQLTITRPMTPFVVTPKKPVVPPHLQQLIPVQKVVEDVTFVLGKFSRSTSRRDAYAVSWKLYRPQQRLLRPIYPVPTRWNSMFLILERYCEMYTVLRDMDYADLGLDTQAEKDALFGRLAGHNNIMPQLLEPLEVIWMWTERMSASLSVTISLVPRAYNAMVTALAPKVSRTDQGVKDFFAAVLSSMEDRFPPYLTGDKQRLVLLAQFLDPRTTFELNKDDDDARDELIEGLVESLSHDFSMADPKDADPTLANDHKDSKRSRQRNITKVKEALKEQLEDFFGIYRHVAAAKPIETDPLAEFWCQQDTMDAYPLLAQMASYYLTAQASEAECERLASQGGLLLEARRRKMGGALAEKLLFAREAAKDLEPRKPRKPRKDMPNKLQNALHLLKHGVPLPRPQPQLAAADAIVLEGADDGDDIIDLGAGMDEGDLQHEAIEAGVELAVDGSFNLANLAELIEEEEAAPDIPVEDIEDDVAAAAPAPAKAPVRRSARQAAALEKLVQKFGL